MRRWAKAGAVAIGLVASAGGGFAAGHATSADHVVTARVEPPAITSDDYAALVDVCQAAHEDTDCLGLVDEFVGIADEQGCGFRDVASVLAAFRSDRPGARDRLATMGESDRLC